MDRKRKSPNATASTSTRKRTSATPTRPAKRYRRVTELGGSRVSNVHINDAKRLNDVKVFKVPNRRAGPGGFTIVATPRARIGDSGVIDGTRYVVRSAEQLRGLIRDRKWRDVERTCTSRITDMWAMFRGSYFNGKIGHWDTSHVTNMAYMFDASVFNQQIGGWNVSRVTDMSHMFDGASAFNQDIRGWDVSRVTNMSDMFNNARSFNQDIGRWDTARVANMSSMFTAATSFNQYIGRWDTSKVTDMAGMFSGAHAFNKPIGGWDVSRVTNMLGMFYGARSFNQDIGRWDTSKVTDMAIMFSGAISFNQAIGRWNVSRVTNMKRMFHDARAFRQDVSAWATRLPPNVRIDPETRALIDDIQAFRARRYRLHPEANAVDPVLMNRVPLNDARVIAGDVVHSRGNIRHIFHKNTLNAMLGASRGRSAKHPITRSMTFTKAHIVPLRDVLHREDANLYRHIGDGKTVKQVRNSRNSRKT